MKKLANVPMKPLLHQGKILDGYYIEIKDNEPRIYSGNSPTSQSPVNGGKFGWLRRMSITTEGKNSYPKSKFYRKGTPISVDTHRVIAENLVPFPKPKGISQEDWDGTPQSIKDHMMELYFVNHIDHDKYNCHPSNLEWATSKENAHAYLKHSGKQRRL